MIFVGQSGDGEQVYLDATRSRAVFICGKRGSGKSYTTGVFLEELVERDDVLVIVADPMRNFHTMSLPNHEQESVLWNWGLSAKGVPVRLLVPGDPVRRYGKDVIEIFEGRGVQVESLRVNPGDIPPDGWLDLFGLDITQPMGIALYRAVQKCRDQSGTHFFIPDLIDRLQRDPQIRETSVQALVLRLETAANEWDIFSSRYREVGEVFVPQTVNVIDLGLLEISRFGLRNLVLAVLVRDLFRKRRDARLREELGLPSEIPKVWLAIDEAQEFVPAGKVALAKEPLIQWVKEGRQPGLSLILASQQPGAVDREVLSQCDVVLCHKVTATDDVDSLNRLSHDYMARELKVYLKQLSRTGEAIMVDDSRERVDVVQIRPRRSKHGGAEL
ncbi:MAG TPA: ATP-binding protein [Desulfotomaculum sp.]|nr:ATP-binding protein [Desulfotomaculum sp.]